MVDMNGLTYLQMKDNGLQFSTDCLMLNQIFILFIHLFFEHEEKRECSLNLCTISCTYHFNIQ